LESTSGIQKVAGLLLFIAVFWSACGREARVAENFNEGYFDLLSDGDLIFRRGNGFFSNHFREFSEKRKEYSHVGILCKKTDSIFVIHAEASELTGIGFVRKDLLTDFLEGIEEWAVFRVKDAPAHTISDLALKYCDTPFDLDFDLCDTSAVYCSELVALCVNAAFNTAVITASTVKAGKPFIAIDDAYPEEKVELIFKSPQTSAH
jgi:Permuted papain-like amidase enzyme, YaeF/YiiX, C92 family